MDTRIQKLNFTLDLGESANLNYFLLKITLKQTNIEYRVSYREKERLSIWSNVRMTTHVRWKITVFYNSKVELNICGKTNIVIFIKS